LARLVVPSKEVLMLGPAIGWATPSGSTSGGHDRAQNPEHVECP
jgi:hypothetical protein